MNKSRTKISLAGAVLLTLASCTDTKWQKNNPLHPVEPGPNLKGISYRLDVPSQLKLRPCEGRFNTTETGGPNRQYSNRKVTHSAGTSSLFISADHATPGRVVDPVIQITMTNVPEPPLGRTARVRFSIPRNNAVFATGGVQFTSNGSASDIVDCSWRVPADPAKRQQITGMFHFTAGNKVIDGDFCIRFYAQ